MCEYIGVYCLSDGLCVCVRKREDKWSKRKNCPSFTRFWAPSYFEYSSIFFSPSFPVNPAASIFSDPRVNISTPQPQTTDARLMMSIFHSSSRANFCFSQHFAPYTYIYIYIPICMYVYMYVYVL